MNKKLTLTILFLLVSVAVFAISTLVPSEIEGKWITTDGKEIWEFELINKSDGLLYITNTKTGEEELYGWYYAHGTYFVQFAYKKHVGYIAARRTNNEMKFYNALRSNSDFDYILRRLENE
jgi:hypothetical protein